MMEYVLVALGLGALLVSGEILVKGAVGIAYRFRISPLVIGMTIVSIGTSSPELLVSLQAALGGYQDIAVANVIGSNIANITLVLGITALIFPIPVDRNSIRIDWPAMMVATVLFYVLVLDLELQRWEGAFFIIALVVFITWLIRRSRKKYHEIDEIAKKEAPVNIESSLIRDTVFIVAGSIGLVFGAKWLVDGSVTIAESLGVSQRIIGITVVAFGTSLPELATSAVAAFRKQTDISVGNLIGSNLFNILAILGITSFVKPIGISQEIMDFDIFWMLGISAILFPLMFLGRTISRVKGAFLAAVYIVYIYLLF